ncbi:MAG: hypothetical protein OEV06_09715 [Anaerolineae bacterium]|nr:hypothetical protein [Anaerolineae bacterium]
MRTVRASELATYVYCRRAWGYQLQGKASENAEVMAQGWGGHNRHSRRVVTAGCVRYLAYGFLLSSILLFAVHMVNGILG